MKVRLEISRLGTALLPIFDYGVIRRAYCDYWAAALTKITNMQGKEVFVKEHACILTGPDVLFASVYDDDKGLSPFLLAPGEKHTNPTYVPDDFLLAMQPIFQIRHPVLMFPSLLRAQLKVFSPCHPGDPRFVALLTLRYSRALYDWYVNNTDAMAPKVIDADDIMNDRSAVRQLCCETGLDADAVQYEWETTEEKDFVMATFKSTLNASKGIKPGLEARSLNIEEEKVKWAAEFGEKDAEDLAKFVYEAMPDYEYLLERRVRGDQK